MIIKKMLKKIIKVQRKMSTNQKFKNQLQNINQNNQLKKKITKNPKKKKFKNQKFKNLLQNKNQNRRQI